MSIGLQDGYLESMAHGQQAIGYPSSNIPLYHIKHGSQFPIQTRNQVIVHMRFFAALVLRELIEETPWSLIEERYCVHRGQIQALQESAVTFSSMISSFCTALKWKHLKSLFTGMKHRLNFGVKGELVPLCSIPHVKSFIARALYKGGFKTVQSVASASVEEIYKCLRDEIPFRGASNGDNLLDQHYSYLNKFELRRAQQIVSGAIRAIETNSILVYDEDEENSYDDEPLIHCSPTKTNTKKEIKQSEKENNEPEASSKRKFTPVPIPSSSTRLPFSVLSPNETNKAMENTKPGMKNLQSTNKRPLDHMLKYGSKRSKIQKLTSHHDQQYEIILLNTQEESFNEFIKTFSEQPRYSFNLTFVPTDHTCTSHRVTNTLTGLSVCWPSQHNDAKGIPIVDTVYHFALDSKALRVLKPVLQDRSSVKISLNMQLHMKLFYEVFIHLPSTNIRDVIVADWILKPSDEQAFTKQRKTLQQAWKCHFNSSLRESRNKCNVDERIRTSCQIAVHCFRLMMEQEILLKQNNLMFPYETIEMPLSSVLSKLEFYGVRFNGKDVNQKGRCTVDEWIDVVLEKQDQIERNIRQYVCSKNPREVSNKYCAGFLSSNEKVAELLFDDMKLVYDGIGESRSTNKEVLQKLQDAYPSIPIFSEVMLWRSLDNLRTKHLNSFCTEFVKFDSIARIRKVYAQQVSTAHVTGRLNVESPNLQNVPHSIQFEHPNPTPDMIRNAIRSGLRAPLASISVRSAFVPRNENYVLLSADYQQIELRLIAHLSNDESLLQILRDPDCDPFREMASVMFSCQDQSKVTENQRKIVKELWYATIYGMGLKTLSSKLCRALGSSSTTKPEEKLEQARLYMHQFSERFQQMDQYRLIQVREQLIENGYVQTIAGRKRYWDDVQDKLKDESTIESYRRHALSTICQGSAADIFKSALILIDRYLEELNVGRSRSNPIASLLMHIHDEIVLEVEKNFVDAVASRIRTCMETAASHFGATLKLPTPVKMKVGANWAEMNNFEVRNISAPSNI